jgi:hypothetical protein
MKNRVTTIALMRQALGLQTLSRREIRGRCMDQGIQALLVRIAEPSHFKGTMLVDFGDGLMELPE